MRGLVFDIAHTISVTVLLLTFALLYQRRIMGVLHAFTLQALAVAAAAAWQAYTQDAPHLYVTAGIALVFKASILPYALRRIVVRLGIHRAIETGQHRAVECDGNLGFGHRILRGMIIHHTTQSPQARPGGAASTADPLQRAEGSGV